jgi:hypothetical protein
MITANVESEMQLHPCAVAPHIKYSPTVRYTWLLRKVNFDTTSGLRNKIVPTASKKFTTKLRHFLFTSSQFMSIFGTLFGLGSSTNQQVQLTVAHSSTLNLFSNLLSYSEFLQPVAPQ